MSQENVELMRAGVEAVNRRDIATALQGMDPGVRFEHRLAALQGSFVGIDGVRGWFADLIEHFDSWWIYCDDIRDLGNRVLALGTIRTTGSPARLPGSRRTTGSPTRRWSDWSCTRPAGSRGRQQRSESRRAEPMPRKKETKDNPRRKSNKAKRPAAAAVSLPQRQRSASRGGRGRR